MMTIMKKIMRIVKPTMNDDRTILFTFNKDCVMRSQNTLITNMISYFIEMRSYIKERF